jgi:hypothetical protein
MPIAHRHLVWIVLVFGPAAAHADSMDPYSPPLFEQAAPEPTAPRLAVATDPIGLVSGSYALSATYVASHHVGIRADVTIFEDVPLLASTGWRASINAPIYLDRALSGPYVEPGVAVAERLAGIGLLGGSADGSMAPYAVPIHTRTVEPQIFVGWQWLYRSRLSIAAAIGAARQFVNDGTGASYSIPLSYLRVGLAF